MRPVSVVPASRASVELVSLELAAREPAKFLTSSSRERHPKVHRRMHNLRNSIFTPNSRLALSRKVG